MASELTPEEVRVLGCLIEKKITTEVAALREELEEFWQEFRAFYKEFK